MASPTNKLPDTPLPRELPLLVRWLLTAFALLCLVLGVVGVFVPGLPTTVFILMAAWAAARSSPRLYRWLWFHPLFGPMLRNWANGGPREPQIEMGSHPDDGCEQRLFWCSPKPHAGLWRLHAFAWLAYCHGCGAGPNPHRSTMDERRHQKIAPFLCI